MPKGSQELTDARKEEIKSAYGNSKIELEKLIRKSYPMIKDYEIKDFIKMFFLYMHGIYPYAYATDKQIEAMDRANVIYERMTVKELAYMGLLKMLPV